MTPAPIRLAQAPGSAGRAAILFDPDCGFCRVSLALLLRWDRHGRLRPVPLGSEEADAFLAAMPDEQRMASWHLVEPGTGAAQSPGTARHPRPARCTRRARPSRRSSPSSPAGARLRDSPPASRVPPSAPTAWWPTIAHCSGAHCRARRVDGLTA